MKLLACILAIAFFCVACNTKTSTSSSSGVNSDEITSDFDGSNGIKFTMSQKDVEKMGFLCDSPEKEADARIMAICKHRKMTGMALNRPTNKYGVVILKDGKVGAIFASFPEENESEFNFLEDQLREFFPIPVRKDNMEYSHETVEDRANKEGVVARLYCSHEFTIGDHYFSTKISISFFSPSYYKSADESK